EAEDGIRDFHVTGVQTCALPICGAHHWHSDVHVHRVDRNPRPGQSVLRWSRHQETVDLGETTMKVINYMKWRHLAAVISVLLVEIGRASCRERVWRAALAVAWSR